MEYELPYGEIGGFPVSTVPGHAGKFIFGYVDRIPVGPQHANLGRRLKGRPRELGINPLLEENTVFSGRFPDDLLQLPVIHRTHVGKSHPQLVHIRPESVMWCCRPD